MGQIPHCSAGFVQETSISSWRLLVMVVLGLGRAGARPGKYFVAHIIDLQII